MPRRSAEHLALGSFIAGGRRLQPPVHLSAAERGIWLEIVGTCPPGHFISEDVHLLEAYCAAVVQQRQATAALAGRQERFNRVHWNEQYNIAVKSLRTLSIALRLGPRARHPVNRKRDGATLSKAASAYELFDNGGDFDPGPRSFDDLRKLDRKQEDVHEED